MRKSASNQLSLATIPILGQAPSICAFKNILFQHIYYLIQDNDAQSVLLFKNKLLQQIS